MDREKIIYVSHHGKKRIRKRCGVSKKSALRCAEKAREYGMHYDEVKGAVRRWLENSLGVNRDIFVHGDKAYIFSENNILITVLQMPPDIVRKHHKNIKKRNGTMDPGARRMQREYFSEEDALEYFGDIGIPVSLYGDSLGIGWD